MRVRQDLERAQPSRASGSPSSGFAVSPFQQKAPPGPATALPGAGPASVLPPAESPREAVEKLARQRFGPITFEGEQHYVRYRIQNGHVKLGINPEWRDLSDILRALDFREAGGGAISQEVNELRAKSVQTLQRLDQLLRFRNLEGRQLSIEEQIGAAQQIAGLFGALAERTGGLDIYGGTLHGNGAQDTDVVGFDRQAVVQPGPLIDPAPFFDPDEPVIPPMAVEASSPDQGMAVEASAQHSGSGMAVEDEAQMKADGPLPLLGREAARQVRDVQRGGQPLSRELRGFFEARFGTSLAHVRLHADAAGDRASRHLNARAFTLGSHIAVRRDQYAPHSTVGRWLIAHELAHALPAGRRGAGGPPRLGGTRDRAELAADRTADAVMAGALPPGEMGGAAADGVVRRAPPTGTAADPIKIVFFKTKGIYKNFQATGYSGALETFKPFETNELPTPKMRTPAANVGATAVNKQVGGSGPLVKGVEIGVTDPNTTLKGQILQRILSPNRWAEGIFKTVLRQRDFDWTNFAPDHLHDLAMSGPDQFPNLWPLDSTVNGLANQTYQQKVQYLDAAGAVKTNAVSFLTNKYFLVTRLQKP